MKPRYILLVGAMFLVAGATVATWWLRPVTPIPPIPDDIQDAEVFEAIESARQRVIDDPSSAAAWGQLGKVMLAQLFDREAEACFDEADRLDPADPRWVYGNCVIAVKRHPDRAVLLLRKALAAAGESWPDFRMLSNFRLADELLERGHLDEAEERYQVEQSRDPASAHAALGLGLIARARGNDIAAREWLFRAKTSPCARKYATSQLAAMARADNDPATADALEKEIAALPTDLNWPDPFMDEIADMRVGQRAFERKIRNLEGSRQFDEAARVFLERLKKMPSAELYTGAGMNLARLRKYDEALPLLREAVRLEPDSANANYSLGLALFARAERDWLTTPDAPHLKDWLREALTHSKRAAELRPGHAKSYLFWGLSLKYLGEPEAALAPLRMALACQSADPDIQLGLGQALLEAGHFGEAEKHLNNARELAPNDPRPTQALERLHKQAK